MPETLHLDAVRPADIIRAAALLRDGRLVAFATETVYGLGASAFSPKAVAAIFAAKQRPAWDPLIVHIAALVQLDAVATVPAALALRVEQLASAFWPGPLTLLLPRTATLPDAVTAGRELVGVRIPSHPVAQALLHAAGVPIAAPSANRFGHTSPTTAAHVLADLNGRIDAVLDAGPTSIGLESTVLDPTQTPMVLYRPGAITAEQLTSTTGIAVEIFRPVATQTPQNLPSPGVGIRHYAPRASLQLVEGRASALTSALEASEHAPGTIGVLLPTDWSLTTRALIQPWAAWEDAQALAATLFAGLRSLDDRGVRIIFVPLPPPGGMRDAIRDRMLKAARPE